MTDLSTVAFWAANAAVATAFGLGAMKLMGVFKPHPKPAQEASVVWWKMHSVRAVILAYLTTAGINWFLESQTTRAAADGVLVGMFCFFFLFFLSAQKTRQSALWLWFYFGLFWTLVATVLALFFGSVGFHIALWVAGGLIVLNVFLWAVEAFREAVRNDIQSGIERAQYRAEQRRKGYL
jgi:divalent metal cation (Fe/Co/Zn/Cd) transporter